MLERFLTGGDQADFFYAFPTPLSRDIPLVEQQLRKFNECLGLNRINVNYDVYIRLHVRTDIADSSHMVDRTHRIGLNARRGLPRIYSLPKLFNLVGQARF